MPTRETDNVVALWSPNAILLAALLPDNEASCSSGFSWPMIHVS